MGKPLLVCVTTAVRCLRGSDQPPSVGGSRPFTWTTEVSRIYEGAGCFGACPLIRTVDGHLTGLEYCALSLDLWDLTTDVTVPILQVGS